MEVKTLSTTLGLIAFIVGGTLGTVNYFVSREDHARDIEAVKQTAETLAEINADYLLDLRIEQKEEIQLRLEEKAQQAPLDAQEQLRLNRTQEQLKKLYQIQEEQH